MVKNMVNSNGVQRVQAEVVSGGALEIGSPARVGAVARIQSQTRLNRTTAITKLTAEATTAVAGVYAIASAASEVGIHRLDRQDALMARLGEEAAREHQIAKENLRRRLQQIQEIAAVSIHEIYQRDLEEIACQPDSTLYDPSPGERFGAWFWDNTSIELQRRNLAPLTTRERLKALVVGGVQAAKVDAYDREQVAERREHLDIRRQLDSAHAQLAALVSRMADPEVLTAGRPEEQASDEEVAAQITAVEDLLRLVQSPAREPESIPRRRARAQEQAAG